MFELEKTDRVQELIAITKSDSGVSGPVLAKAHIELGQLIATRMPYMNPDDTTVVAILRGGIFFAEGIYFQLGCKFEVLNPKESVFVRPKTKNVILVDSVINTGKTIKKYVDKDMLVACCVINHSALGVFDNIYTVRVSQNSFVGTSAKIQSGNVGPDTTMRLFNQI